MRHGFMIVGDSMGGKTRAYQVLAAALADLHISGLMEEWKVRAIGPLTFVRFILTCTCTV